MVQQLKDEVNGQLGHSVHINGTEVLDLDSIRENKHRMPLPFYGEEVDGVVLSESVNKITEILVRQWRITQTECLVKAEELEKEAAGLRAQAEKLQAGIDTLPDEIKGCCKFERKAHQHVLAVTFQGNHS